MVNDDWACPLFESFEMYCCPIGMLSDIICMTLFGAGKQGPVPIEDENGAQRRAEPMRGLVCGVAA